MRLTSLLRHVLRATTACAFWAPQLPKVLRTRAALNVSLRAVLRSRHGPFCRAYRTEVLQTWGAFCILTAEGASRHSRFHFFRHLTVQKCSDAEEFCTLRLRNAFRATVACTNFWSLIRPDVSARRFSEPAFQPPARQDIGKNIVFRDFSTFFYTLIFFLLALSSLTSSPLPLSLLWLFPPLLLHLSILSEVWLLNVLHLFARSGLSPASLGSPSKVPVPGNFAEHRWAIHRGIEVLYHLLQHLPIASGWVPVSRSGRGSTWMSDF